MSNILKACGLWEATKNFLESFFPSLLPNKTAKLRVIVTSLNIDLEVAAKVTEMSFFLEFAVQI